mgnify:CR=1 FL=1
MRHMGHKQKYEARTVWTICMLYFWECTYSLLHMVTWPTSSNSVNGRWTSSSLWLWTRFIFSVFLSVVMTLFLFLFCFFFLFSFFLQTLYRMFSKVDFQSGFRPYHCSIYSWYIFWVEFAPAVWLSRTVFYRELFKLFFFNANDGKWHFSIAHPFDLWSWDAIVGHVTGHQYAIVRDRYCDAAPNLLQIYLSCWKQSSVALP